MRITADHAFHIGSQHLRSGMPCQDYALSGLSPESGYAIVSDGCSTGGKTDVGARIIAHSTSLAIRGTNNIDLVDAWCQDRGRRAMVELGLRQDDMLATNVYAAINIRGDSLIRIVGDGVFATVDHLGDTLMVRQEWDNNVPLYRAYAADGYRGFIDRHGGDLTAFVSTGLFHNRGPSQNPNDFDARYRLGDSLDGLNYSLTQKRLREIKLIAVFSDGVTQVDGTDWRDVVAELMNFKSTEGDFVKRRMNRFLKDCLKHGKGPIDDISMACIHIDHQQNT